MVAAGGVDRSGISQIVIGCKGFFELSSTENRLTTGQEVWLELLLAEVWIFEVDDRRRKCHSY